MKIGIIGEKENFISFSMLRETLLCESVEIVWFVEAKLPSHKKEELYGQGFDYGFLFKFLGKAKGLLFGKNEGSAIDCEQLCVEHEVSYIVPRGLSINAGLPESMYSDPDVEYVLVAGCDQLLNERGLRIAKEKIINYHYSPLPAYRGKFAVFWQWYNREPFIGFSFHEVNLDVDAGEIVYQGKVGYDANASLGEVTQHVVSASADQIDKLYKCLESSERVLLDEELQESMYPSQKYLNLITADRTKTIEEILALYERLGSVRLKNGISLARIVSSGHDRKDRYDVDNEGIYIPLANGYIKGALAFKAPFYLLKILIGEKRLLKGLN